MFFLSLIFSTLFAADCERPFPLKVNNKIEAQCIMAEKIYQIGHIRFINIPRARTANDLWPYEYTYFASSTSTRNKLCKLFGAKKEVPRSHIYDPAGNNIQYSRNGFTKTRVLKTIKVLACSII